MSDRIKRAIKLSVLAVAQLFGLFALARWLTRRDARILCYHGFAYRDEHQFAAKLFMTPATFSKRMAQLAGSGYTVVPLSTLIDKLERGESIDNLLVITVDDGWTGFARFAWPVLQQHRLPCTLYLTTWYAEKERPVLNVLRRYLQWRGVTLPAEQADNLAEYQQLQQAAQVAGVALACEDGELFRLSTLNAVAVMAQQGLDVQLHTHRHCLPLVPAELQDEVQHNRQLIEALTQRPANELCYPSGEYQAAHLPLLSANQVRSATTTRLGLVSAQSDRLQLPRLLDGENWHPLEFAAELSGFMTLLRRATGRDDSAGVARLPLSV
jgi:peptidoglycan/xylan/chitin deacetylase (PgdA/CDA1 family)